MFHSHKWETVVSQAGWYQLQVFGRLVGEPDMRTQVIQRCVKCGEIKELLLRGNPQLPPYMPAPSAERGTG